MTDIPPFHGLDVAGGAARHEGAPIPLADKELRVLERLMMDDPQPVSFADMLDHLYGPLDEPETRIIGIFGLKLSRKLHVATGGMIFVTGHQGDRLSLSAFDPDPPRFPEAAALRA